jgi:chromosome segregation ATPase
MCTLCLSSLTLCLFVYLCVMCRIDSAVATERGICNERYGSQITELKSRVEAYLLTKTVMEEKYGELAKELASVRAEGEKFAAEMKSSRQSLLDENTKLKNTNSDLKTGAMTAKGDLAHLQAQIDEYKQTVEDIKIEKKEVYASLQDSVTDRQRLLELTEKLKHKLDSLNASRVDDFERVERSVLNTVEKEFETLKIQLKITGGKSNGKDKVLLSASSSAANLHSY